MKYAAQQLSRERLELLGEDGLDITCWVRPHHGLGWIKHILAFPEERGVIVAGLAQSFSVFSSYRERVKIDESLRYFEHSLGAACLDPILNTLVTTSLCWRRPQSPSSVLGGSHFGLRVEWAGIETERRWQGGLEDIDEVTLSLWKIVDTSVPNPETSVQ